jgi:putative transposase
MAENPRFPQRKSPRLQGYDYAQEGAYFITICVQNRLHLLGEIVDEVMILNAAGMMVSKWWTELPSRFPDIDLDLYVVMPNHFHAIVMISRVYSGSHPELPLQVESEHTSLNDLIGWFKTMTTNDYIRAVKNQQWRPFSGKLWQRSYHDHIIRDEASRIAFVNMFCIIRLFGIKTRFIPDGIFDKSLGGRPHRASPTSRNLPIFVFK